MAKAKPAAATAPVERVAVRVLTPLQDGADRYAMGETAELPKAAVDELLALTPPAVELIVVAGE